MEPILRVVRPFGGRAVGDMIESGEVAREIMSGPHRQDVLRVSASVAGNAKSKEA